MWKGNERSSGASEKKRILLSIAEGRRKKKQGCRDSNPGMSDPETDALPLGDTPVSKRSQEEHSWLLQDKFNIPQSFYDGYGKDSIFLELSTRIGYTEHT
jgi:hypothetical protein